MVFNDEEFYDKAEVVARIKMSKRAWEDLEARERLPRFRLTQRTVRYLGRDLNALLQKAASRGQS